MDEYINTPAAEQAEQTPEQPSQMPEKVAVCDVQFRSGSKIYYFDPDGLPVHTGSHVIIDTARGPEFGYCTSGIHQVRSAEVVAPLRKVLRLATELDEKINNDNKAKEKKAYEICLQKIEDFGLDMQLVSAECAFDGSKILFFFTADGRVDFRELVKSLASVFHTRIELRQIGVRDKAKMVGGLGICGRPFCCGQFLDDFQPVSIKMAKTQNLSLNPTKISGTCGRLMCCLKYEQEAYEELLKTSPKVESFVDTPDGRGTVLEVNLMRQSVKVRMEKAPEEVYFYKNCDICVLRNGKAKKTDPPIPEDFAPISGARLKQEPEQLPRLERKASAPAPPPLIRVEKTEAAAPPLESGKAEPSQDRYRRKHRRKDNHKSPYETDRPVEPKRTPATEQKRPAPPEQKKPAAEQRKAEQSRKPEAVKTPSDAERKPRSNNRSRHYYHKRPKSGGKQN